MHGSEPEVLEVCERTGLASVNRGPLAMGRLTGRLWAVSDATVPIPGRRTVSRVEDNAGDRERGPLTPDRLKETAALPAS